MLKNDNELNRNGLKLLNMKSNFEKFVRNLIFQKQKY